MKKTIACLMSAAMVAGALSLVTGCPSRSPRMDSDRPTAADEAAQSSRDNENYPNPESDFGTDRPRDYNGDRNAGASGGSAGASPSEPEPSDGSR